MYFLKRFLHKVIWYQVFLSNTNNLQTSIWPQYEYLTGTTTPGQNGPGSNDNEGVPHTPQILRIVALPSDAVLCHTQGTHFFGDLNPQQEPSWLGL